jgi:hypothetical protein
VNSKKNNVGPQIIPKRHNNLKNSMVLAQKQTQRPTVQNRRLNPVAGAHTSNPRHLGSRDQEDHGLKPAQTNSSQDPISKMHNTKMGWKSGANGTAPTTKHEALSSKPSNTKKKKKNKRPKTKTTLLQPSDL